jgi:hypothetical protein
MGYRGSGQYAGHTEARGGGFGRALRMVGLPARLVQVVRQHRRAVPAPRIYLAAAALAAGLALAAALVLDAPWWLVPLTAAVAAVVVEGVFATTALRHPGQRADVRADLKAAWLWAVAPRRARAHRRSEYAGKFRTAPFPVYGLQPAWQGLRYLAGWSTEDDGTGYRTSSLSLGHRAPSGELDVVSHTDAPEWELAEDLWSRAGADVGVLADDEFARRRPDPQWTSANIPVEGTPHTFALLTEGDHWTAYLRRDGHTLVLHSESVPLEQVDLVRVTDLTPYEQGTWELEQPPGWNP